MACWAGFSKHAALCAVSRACSVTQTGHMDRRTDELPPNDQMWGSLTLAPNNKQQSEAKDIFCRAFALNHQRFKAYDYGHTYLIVFAHVCGCYLRSATISFAELHAGFHLAAKIWGGSTINEWAYLAYQNLVTYKLKFSGGADA